MNINYKLLPAQKEYLKHRDEPVWGLCCGLASGKTFVSMLDICLRVVQDAEKWFVGSQQISTVMQVQFAQILQFLDEWKVPYKYDKNKFVIELSNGGCIHGCCASSKDLVTGMTGYSGCCFDECALWSSTEDGTDAMRFVEGRCRGMDKNGKLIKPRFRYIGSPSLLPQGFWFNFCKQHPELITTASMQEAVGKTISQEYFQQSVDAYGGVDSPLCRIQVFGEQPSEGSAASIFRREHHPKDLGYTAMGIDCSGGNAGDSAYFFVSNGIDIIAQHEMKEFTQKELLAKALDMYQTYHVDQARIDVTGGFGTYLCEAMGDNHCNVEGVNFGQRAKDPESYLNARAQMWCNLAERWNDAWGDLIKQERLATAYKMNPSGKLAIIEKDVIKKVIGHSPDCGDALALCLYDTGIAPIQQDTLDSIQDMLDGILA